MMRALLSMYSWRYPTVLTYMLQNTEYNVGPYIAWVNRARNFNTIIKRRELERTRRARLLLLGFRLGILAQILLGIALIILGATGKIIGGVYFGLAVVLCYPLIWPYTITLPLLFVKYFIVVPRDQERIAASAALFKNHQGLKIAVAGSYGKTTMKELLVTVLSEAKTVAATPANKNVASSHAVFARNLSGDEDILVIEYGEGEPGDIARFAKVTAPTHAVITGLAPAHLDHYKTVQAAGEDIFSIASFVLADHIYVDTTSDSIKPFVKPAFQAFGLSGAIGWKVHNPKVTITGTRFNLKKGHREISLQSGLVGRHQLAFLSFVAAFGLELGMTDSQLKSGIEKTKPFEHRMQPYRLGDAWVIDDTYNGNLEGIRVGTELLKELTAERKIYVTPGLVDQGKDTKTIHHEVGQLIAVADPAIVVLMKNSVTDAIVSGLQAGNYEGEIRIEEDPLGFYLNLKHIVAAGDLVLMQNDWPDNYA